MAQEEAAVKVFTSTSCGFCKMVKAYLSDKGVSFTEVNIEQDPQAAADLVKQTGQVGVPVTVFNDKDVVVGFDRIQIDNFLKEHNLN